MSEQKNFKNQKQIFEALIAGNGVKNRHNPELKYCLVYGNLYAVKISNGFMSAAYDTFRNPSEWSLYDDAVESPNTP